MASSTLAHSNWRYNIDGGNWQQGSGRSLSVGRSNEPKIYRGWITFSLSNFSAAYIMQASSLFFKRYDSYGTISWDIGLRDSEPPKTFTESDFQYSIANNYSTTSNAEYNVSITAAQMSAFVGKTMYVCFCGYSTSSYCYGEVDMTTSGKTPKLTANYLYAKSTIASASNGTIGSQQTITVTRQDASYTHTLTATCAGRTETIATKSSNLTLTWTPSVANFAPLITNAMSASCTYTLTTYLNDTVVGTDSKTVTLSLPSASVAPTLSLSVVDNAGYASHFNNKYIVGKSVFKVTATPSLKYSATQASLTITANGSTYSSSPVTTGTVKAGQTSISSKVTDSRSQSATASTTVTLLSYANPNLSVTVQRCDSGGTADSSGAYCKVTSTYSITALDNINTRSLTVKYKKASASTYTSVSRTISAYTGTDTYIFAADTDSSYDVQVLLQDYFSTTTVNKVLPTISVVFDLHSSGTGMAFGKVAESADLLDIAWPVSIRNKDFSLYDSAGTRRFYLHNYQSGVLGMFMYNSDGTTMLDFYTDGNASGNPLPVNQGGTGSNNRLGASNLLFNSYTDGNITDFNSAYLGIGHWGPSAANRPSNEYGVCFSFAYNYPGDTSRWWFQLAFGTNGTNQIRRKINAGSWTAWATL